MQAGSAPAVKCCARRLGASWSPDVCWRPGILVHPGAYWYVLVRPGVLGALASWASWARPGMRPGRLGASWTCVLAGASLCTSCASWCPGPWAQGLCAQLSHSNMIPSAAPAAVDGFIIPNEKLGYRYLRARVTCLSSARTKESQSS